MKGLSDKELIVQYRAVWALSMLAKHGQRKEVLEADIIPIIANLVDDEREVEIANLHAGELIFTTLGGLAREALKNLEED